MMESDMSDEKTPVPSGAYYGRDGDFHALNRPGGPSMGDAFHREWYPRRYEFPTEAATGHVVDAAAYLVTEMAGRSRGTLERYDAMLAGWFAARTEGNETAAGHVRWMVRCLMDPLADPTVHFSPDSYQRWIGYVQCWLAMSGLTTVGVEREMTRGRL